MFCGLLKYIVSQFKVLPSFFLKIFRVPKWITIRTVCHFWWIWECHWLLLYLWLVVRLYTSSSVSYCCLLTYDKLFSNPHSQFSGTHRIFFSIDCSQTVTHYTIYLLKKLALCQLYLKLFADVLLPKRYIGKAEKPHHLVQFFFSFCFSQVSCFVLRNSIQLFKECTFNIVNEENLKYEIILS